MRMPYKPRLLDPTCTYDSHIGVRPQMAEAQTTVALKKLEDQLTCAICLDTYKEPKLLHCFHVYCKVCLQRLVVRTSEEPGQRLSLRCPTCRQPTLLPQDTGVDGLPPAFHIENLFEIQEAFERTKVSKNIQCEKCTKTSKPAISFCRDCGKFICELCCDIHSQWKEFSKHEVVSMKQLPLATMKELSHAQLPRSHTLYCSQHKGKELDLYCDTCEELICLLCTVKKHKDHQYDLVEDTFEKHKEEITSSLEPLDGHVSTLSTVLEQLDEQSKGLDDQQATVEVCIRQQVQELHEMLNARKAELLEQLHQETETKLRNLAAQRNELEAVQSQLSGCLTFVKESLRTGSEEEVMQMKPLVMKQIKEITNPDRMPQLEPCESADMKFTTSPELLSACQNFGEVYLSEVVPWRCYAKGDGLKVAEPGETATAIVHIVTSEGKAYTAPLRTLSCELVADSASEKIQCAVKRVGVSQYEISYRPRSRGRHQLHIKIVGEHIRGSPFTVTVKLPVQKLGAPINTITALKRPWGVATSRRGDVIVADYRGHCVSVFSWTNGEKLRSFSSCGVGLRPIHSPRGVAVDSDDNILVVDGSHSVKKFTLDGEFIQAVGREGSSSLEFKRPTGIAVHPHNAKVYVADTDNHRIQILNSDLTFSGEFGGSAELPLKCPWGVAFDSTGNVYVADSGNHCIQVFADTGLFLRQFGREGECEGRLNTPTCISIGGDDLAYVTEYGNHRVSVFTCEGEFLASFGSMGSGPGQFNEPRGITVDGNGYVLVSDCENNSVQFF